jgi:hypothetical protein
MKKAKTIEDKIFARTSRKRSAIAKEAMRRLGIPTGATRAEIDYNAGRSTQVPMGRLIGIESRISRKIAYNGVSIYYELIEATS